MRCSKLLGVSLCLKGRHFEAVCASVLNSPLIWCLYVENLLVPRFSDANVVEKETRMEEVECVDGEDYHASIKDI